MRGLRALPSTAEALGARGPGVQGAPRALPAPRQGRRQGLGVHERQPRRRPPRRRRVHLDRAALAPHQGQADGAGRGARRRDAAAGLRRRLHRRAAPVHRLHEGRDQRRELDRVRAGQAARGPQAHVLLPGAGHPAREGRRERDGRARRARGARLLLRQQGAVLQVRRLCAVGGPGEAPLGQAAGVAQHAHEHVQLQVHVLCRDRADLQGEHKRERERERERESFATFFFSLHHFRSSPRSSLFLSLSLSLFFLPPTHAPTNQKPTNHKSTHAK